MRSKFIIGLFYVFLLFEAKAQMIDNKFGNAFTDQPFFNTSFIRNNHIKSLKGTFVYKKQGDMMRPTTFNHVYEFDTLGRLSLHYETRTDDGTKDSTKNIFYYDSLNRIYEHFIANQKGYFVKSYRYDVNGVLQNYQTHQWFKDSLSQNWQRTLLLEEQMVNKKTDNGYHSIFYNSYDLPFKEKWTIYDSLGFLVEEEELFLMTQVRNKTKYTYNAHGLIASKALYEDTMTLPLEADLFEYDEEWNLLSKKHYRKQKHISSIEVLYNSKTKLIATLITRDVATNFLMILRFMNITYYEDKVLLKTHIPPR